MTTLPEEAVKAACDAYKLEDDHLSGIGMMRALEAAAPHLASVRVKKLEWNEYNDEQGIPDRWDAEASSFGVFYSIEIQHDGFRVVFDHEAVGAVGLFDTLEAAKAAAQADYSARILSALEPSVDACPCTKIQQDETCPVGYPSLLCEICDGKGVLQPSVARELALDIETIKGALADLIGHAKWVDVNFDISYAHLHEAETVFSALSSPDHADAGKVEGGGWLPIESAPKDGTVIDLWSTEFGRQPDCYWGKRSHCCGEDGQYCDSDWHSEPEAWIDSAQNTQTFDDISHWRPLPSAPASEGAE